MPRSAFDSGWDNELYQIGDGLIARFPRREASSSLVENEVRWLPRLAVGLDVDVPQPVFVGRPSERYPWVWSVVNLIPGVGASRVTPAERTGFAEQLADALWCLHLPASPDAPLNPVRGVSLAQERFDARVRERAAGFAEADALLARWDAWSHAPEFDGVDVWVHGDLHPHNLITDGHGTLTGIIDWGDLTAGDPATDLATAWLTFDADGRRIFTERLDDGGLVDAATWQRAKAWALHLGLIFATMSDDSPELFAVGQHTLAQVLAEPV
nr:aminoglycoside phosphotransferase family protein [Propioniciclava soli]